MDIKIYVEGAGPGKDQRAQLREGFQKLSQKLGLQRMPRFTACGGRAQAFDSFNTAQSTQKDQLSLLLVDSEDAVSLLKKEADDPFACQHLKKRDRWEPPPGIQNRQVLLMATCMETWVIADRPALEKHYGKAKLNLKKLPHLLNIETRNRHEIWDALVEATQNSIHPYKKGKRSFRVLAELEPSELRKHLTQFERFETVLKAVCGATT